MVLNPGLLDWGSNLLTTRPLLQPQIQRFYIQTLITCLTKLWDPNSFQDSQGFCSDYHELKKILCQLMRRTKVAHGTAKFFWESFLDIKLCQLTKYQDRNSTSPDTKESVF